MRNSGFFTYRKLFLSGIFMTIMIIANTSCSKTGSIKTVNRENLFTMEYGTSEEKLNLFQIEGFAPSSKTRITMRDGIFYIANGDGAKIQCFSSYGDLLSMIYDPEKNPKPLLLNIKEYNGSDGNQINVLQGRMAVEHPLDRVGEIAIDSDKTIYVADKIPPERMYWDNETYSLLDNVVLRFDRNCIYRDYLGQEGVGGTPFPYISGLYATKNDDCIVVCADQKKWSVYCYDSEGILKYSLSIDRNKLPVAEDPEYIATLDTIIPDPDGIGVYVKIDYYRSVIDETTKTSMGLQYKSSWVYKMNSQTAIFSEKYEILPYEDQNTLKNEAILKTFGFLGVTRFGYLFFSTVNDDGDMIIATYNLSKKTMKYYSVYIDQDEMNYISMHLSDEGILCALLASHTEARIVWWRFDKILSGLVR